MELTAGSGVPWVLVVAGASVVLVGATSFTKFTIAFTSLRAGFGLAGVPSAAAVLVLSLVLTGYVMAPLGSRVLARHRAANTQTASRAKDAGSAPIGRTDGWAEARSWLEAGLPPLQAFLGRNAGVKETALFRRMDHQRGIKSEADALGIVMPAFLLSELKRGLQIAVLILLPFAVIDIVLALLCAVVGVGTASLQGLSILLKLLLFVSVDGWTVLAEALVLSYR